MGTNYYQRTDICDRCNRYKEKHIGKSSAGWEFSFQGYDDGRVMPRIKSFMDWKRELQADSKIFTEYGEEISFEDFVKFVESKKGGTFGPNKIPNLNHFDHCEKEGYHMTNDWKDKEGYSFTSSDFS